MTTNLRWLLAAILLLPTAALCAETPSIPAPAAINLGQAAVPLYGPWKFSIGDSPVDPKTGALLWAEPGFDDSKWETVSLHPMPGWKDPYNGDMRYVAGWTAQGHSGYMGYAWYRLRIPVVANATSQLALTRPVYVDDGYQVYANGLLAGASGTFDIPGKPPRVTSTVPGMLLIPRTADESASTPEMQTIAFRVWMGPMGLTHSAFAGGIHYAPWFGVRSAIAEHTRLDWLEQTVQSAYAPFEGTLLFLLGIVAAGLILFDRSDTVYLWVSAVLIFTALSDAVLAVFTMTGNITLRSAFFFFDVISNPLILCGWIMVWWYWFQLKRPAWFPKVIAVMMLLYMVTKAIGGDFFYGVHPQPPSMSFALISILVRFAFLPLFIMVVVLGIKKQGVEGWLVLPAVLPLFVSQFASDLFSHNLSATWAPFGITIFSGQLATIVSAAAISLLLLRRLLLSVRRQRELVLDVRQAKEVQQLMVPEAKTALHGLMIDSEYQPAQQVSGDFFQIVPHPSDGSILIVLGDVNGKGLRAGMLVALLVGAIRSIAPVNSDPEAILSTLNQRLLGRGQAVATCLAMRISSDGKAVVANAGQVPPYLNDNPLAIEGSLPLGVVDSAQFSVLHFQLNDGDRLVVMSDGIAEATNAKGQLFGFDRVLELVRTRRSAAGICQAAQAFGQEDDIGVISVTKMAASA